MSVYEKQYQREHILQCVIYTPVKELSLPIDC